MVVRYRALVCWLAVSSVMPLATALAVESEVYVVCEVGDSSINIDGLLGEAEWPVESWNTSFSFPWQDRTAPLTKMCCVTQGDRLLFAFQCADPDIVVAGQQPGVELSVAGGDRIEIYFARDPHLREYFCFEISPAGQVLDYRATFPRKFDDSWDWPGLEVAARTRPDGFVVEGSLSLASLTELCGANKSDEQDVLVGAFRAEFSHTAGEKPNMEWISWIRPDTDRPDFHTPSAFGRFRFER